MSAASYTGIPLALLATTVQSASAPFGSKGYGR